MPNASCGATSNAEPRVRRSRPMSAGPMRPGCYEDEMTERAAPFYCPYCGDEDLRPFGERHGEWRGGGFRPVFRLGYVGVAAGWAAGPAGAPPPVTWASAEGPRSLRPGPAARQ